MPAAVVFDHVYKKFRRGERHDSLRDLVPWLARRLFTPRRSADALEKEEFWALRDASFEVQPGHALGIVGGNGAGKSTTLKILTRILKATKGGCAVRGRVGALIEVAAGFHPDLTGRENVYLQGAIMGMRRGEIAQRFDEIVEFAGVSEFIDTPVKRYSSGMNARLGFSIAAHLRPEVLIIDEVLSVGDMAFQQRCVERMREFKRSGVTIVFVSHNLQAVVDLCDEAVHLNRGVVEMWGPTSEVLGSYVRGGATAAAEHSASNGIAIQAVRLTDGRGRATDSVGASADLILSVDYIFKGAPTDLTFGILLHRSTDGLLVYEANFTPAELNIEDLITRARQASESISITVDYRLRASVTRGHYHFGCHVFHNPHQKILDRMTPAAHLTVFEQRTWQGVADLSVVPSVRRRADIVSVSR